MRLRSAFAGFLVAANGVLRVARNRLVDPLAHFGELTQRSRSSTGLRASQGFSQLRADRQPQAVASRAKPPLVMKALCRRVPSRRGGVPARFRLQLVDPRPQRLDRGMNGSRLAQFGRQALGPVARRRDRRTVVGRSLV